MTCDGKTHNLEEIYVHHRAVSEAVVRWCSDCGAVVVDEDYDTRTNPGAYVPMKLPRMAYPNQRQKQ